jgi:hypothetical protein
VMDQPQAIEHQRFDGFPHREVAPCRVAQFLAVCSKKRHHSIRQPACLIRCASTRSPVNTVRGHGQCLLGRKATYSKRLVW